MITLTLNRDRVADQERIPHGIVLDWLMNPGIVVVRLNPPGEGNRTNLRCLSLRGHPYITDTVFAHISNISLDLLDVTYTGVTADGVRNYLRYHPGCRVVHESFCTCVPHLHF